MPKTTLYQKIEAGGAAGAAEGGLGRMPLTLWVIVAAVVLYLYIRRARLGIDQHPAERSAPPAYRTPAPKPTVSLKTTVPLLPLPTLQDLQGLQPGYGGTN